MAHEWRSSVLPWYVTDGTNTAERDSLTNSVKLGILFGRLSCNQVELRRYGGNSEGRSESGRRCAESQNKVGLDDEMT